MKNILKTLILISILSSCDDKIDSLENLNKEPFSEFYTIKTGQWVKSENNFIIKEDVKLYNEENKLPYSVSLRLKDVNNNFGNVVLNSDQSNNEFFIDDKPYYQNLNVKLDSFSLSHKNSFMLNKKFKITIIDTWDKKHTIFFDLNFKENIPPTPILNVNVVNNLEYEINASNSVDGDKNLGGFIRQYEYVINNNFVVLTSNKKINHVFTPGSHNIKLRVKDSDNIWSSYVQQNIVVN